MFAFVHPCLVSSRIVTEAATSGALCRSRILRRRMVSEGGLGIEEGGSRGCGGEGGGGTADKISISEAI